MSTRIRLARAGSKNRPFFKIVVSDKRSPRDGKFIEKLGTYNPLLPKEDENRVLFDEERVKYWLSKGATPSYKMAIFLSKSNLVEKPPIPSPSFFFTFGRCFFVCSGIGGFSTKFDLLKKIAIL